MAQSLTEVQIEFRSEMEMNRLDRQLHDGMDQWEYDLRVVCVDIWAEEMYKIRNQQWGQYDG